jgi:hypothetical protein
MVVRCADSEESCSRIKSLTYSIICITYYHHMHCTSRTAYKTSNPHLITPPSTPDPHVLPFLPFFGVENDCIPFTPFFFTFASTRFPFPSPPSRSLTLLSSAHSIHPHPPLADPSRNAYLRMQCKLKHAVGQACFNARCGGSKLHKCLTYCISAHHFISI